MGFMSLATSIFKIFKFISFAKKIFLSLNQMPLSLLIMEGLI